MATTPTQVVSGTLRPDGTLELDQAPLLPPGRVRVTVESLAPEPARGDILDVIARIRQSQEARGYRGRTIDEMQADEAASLAEDEEYEARWRAIHEQTSDPRRSGPPD
jgi:hypothetical protein